MNSPVKDDSPTDAAPSGDDVTSVAGRTPLVTVSNLVKRYDKKVALKSIDLTIYEGEFLVLLGPSGCGKTTTMRCIAGLEEPSEGSIAVGEKVFYDADKGVDVAPNKRDIGMVFQSYALWPHKSVLQNVIYPLRMQKVSKAEATRRSLEVIAMVGLEGYAERDITTLSGGQMQRVALARAVVAKPRVLFLDEPLSNLDAKLRLRLRHELKELQHSLGVTTVMVTHDQSEALGLADRIVVMDNGRVVQIGTPKALYSNPQDAFVADFLGMSNRIRVSVSATADGTATGTIAGVEKSITAVDRRGDRAEGEAVLCFRPAAAGILPISAIEERADENRWRGTIVSTQYKGVGYQVRLRLPDGTILDTEDQSSHEFLPGEECILSIAAKDCFVFDTEAK